MGRLNVVRAQHDDVVPVGFLFFASRGLAGS